MKFRIDARPAQRLYMRAYYAVTGIRVPVPGSWRVRIPLLIWLDSVLGGLVHRLCYARRRWRGDPHTPAEAVEHYACGVDLRRVAHVPPAARDFRDLRAVLRLAYGGEPGCAVAVYLWHRREHLRLHTWWTFQRRQELQQREHEERQL